MLLLSLSFILQIVFEIKVPELSIIPSSASWSDFSSISFFTTFSAFSFTFVYTTNLFFFFFFFLFFFLFLF